MAEQQTIISEPCWHEQSAETILATLHTTEFGLSKEESQNRLKVYGLNRLPEPERKSSFFRFLLQFHNILIYVLLGAALVTSFLQHWVDTAVIIAVVVINALIGFIQEGKAEKALDAMGYRKRTGFLAGLTVAQLSEFSLVFMAMGVLASERSVAIRIRS